jgi:hypothetical protein
MSDVEWETSYSVDSQAVANWDDPPATFELERPFTAGSRGTTRMPGQEPRRWRLAEVNPLESYVLETELDKAVMTFEWPFDRLAGRTRPV